MPPVDIGTSFEKAIDQNNKAFQENMDNLGKSIANVFGGGLNAPKPIPGSIL